MKILILYTYNEGYLSNFFFELSRKLFEDGHKVFNMSLKWHKEDYSQDNVHMIIRHKGGYLSNYYNIYKAIKSVRPDIVLSNFSYVNPALLFGRLLGVKSNAVWFHSLNNQMNPSKLKIIIKKQFLRLADVVIANSYLTKSELANIYGVSELKLTAIPFWTNILNGAITKNEKAFIKTNKSFHIGCPGRLTAHKNQKILIEALHKLQSEGFENMHVYFAGRGEDMDELKLRTKELGLNDNISFLEHLSAGDMITFYSTMSVIVLPSLDEAFGLVLIEAIALGRPVIVSSKFGALTFIDESNFDISKITFNPNSAHELQQKLKLYYEQLDKSSDYFKNLYNATFDKQEIYESIKKAIAVTK